MAVKVKGSVGKVDCTASEERGKVYLHDVGKDQITSEFCIKETTRSLEIYTVNKRHSRLVVLYVND